MLRGEPEMKAAQLKTAMTIAGRELVAPAARRRRLILSPVSGRKRENAIKSWRETEGEPRGRERARDSDGTDLGEMGGRERETREREREREETAVRDHLGPPNNTSNASLACCFER